MLKTPGYGERFYFTGRRAFRWLVLTAAALWLGLTGFLPSAQAHAEMIRSAPASGERLDVSPPAVDLMFTERLDTGSVRLSVLDQNSRKVATAKPEKTEEGKGLRLALPELEEGHYTVSYSVISADGHPVSGAFVFTVGNPAALPGASQLDPHDQVGHDHGGSTATDRMFLIYLTRTAYYAGLLATVGLILWGFYRRASPIVREFHSRALAFAGKFTLIATLAYVAISLMDLTEDEPISEWLRILTETTIGHLYAAELLLALAAPLLGGFGLAGRMGWAAVFLAVEAWSGHAAAFSPKAYTITLDFVHLAAASLWAGGLILLLAVWLKDRQEAGRFALVFSRWALYSFFALWVTGVLATFAYLPSLEYLTYTYWGKWLMVKAGVSLVVAVVALVIRARLNRGGLPQNLLIKTDAGLLASIVLVVGIFTYLSPLPPNEPLHFHEMGTDLHVTVRITPNVPGENDFVLKVWLPEKDGEPKQVKLRMIPLGREDVGPIEVPLQPYEDEEFDSFEEFAKYTYKAEGPFLPFADEWKAEVLVTGAQGTELKRETVFRIY